MPIKNESWLKFPWGPKEPALFVQFDFGVRCSQVLSDRRGELKQALAQIAIQGAARDAINAQFSGVLQQFEIVQGDLEIQHLKADWLQGWFPNQPVAALFVRALMVAIEVADERQLPRIEMYWAVSPTDQVEFAVSRSPVQATLVLFTPPPQYVRATVPTGALEDIWTVSAEADEVRVAQVERRALKEEPLPFADKLSGRVRRLLEGGANELRRISRRF